MAAVKKTIDYRFSPKHVQYIRRCAESEINVAEGAIRAGKTVDNVWAFAHELKITPDKIHVATGSTVANAKMNIGDCDGFGLEAIFRGQCHWGKYKSNEALMIKGPATRNRLRIVIFAGGEKANSYKSIRGNSYGMWIATEINLHHDNTIKEAFNRTAASRHRKVFWDLNPDNPNASIYSEYIDKYMNKQKAGELSFKYNYEHFTIDDNITITEARKQAIKDQYDVTSIWYIRDILGKRVIAEGLIYRNLANAFHNKKIRPTFVLDRETAVKEDFAEINIGVDFGGAGSAHAFSASGITRGHRKLIFLASDRIPCDKEEIDPERLGDMFCDFVYKIVNMVGTVTNVYCDSAEQTLIAGLKASARRHGLGWLRIQDALKTLINDRIRLMTMMYAQSRLFFVEGYTDALEMALCQAVWDPKEIAKAVRLDDGTSDIDSLDASEYTFERSISRLVKISWKGEYR